MQAVNREGFILVLEINNRPGFGYHLSSSAAGGRYTLHFMTLPLTYGGVLEKGCVLWVIPHKYPREISDSLDILISQLILLVFSPQNFYYK